MRFLAGIETEYGIMAKQRGSDAPLEAEAAGRLLFSHADVMHHGTNLFLPNGGRLYLDVGAHPEYATAECDRLWDLLNQDRAGALILENLQTKTINDDGQVVYLFRNNVDSAGNSFGCHENYLAKRGSSFTSQMADLVSFLVTRQILVGAGAIKKHPDGSSYYAFSVRSDYMEEPLSAGTTRDRPIINTRDEPLADSTQFRRLHVIVGDSNMSEASTLLKITSMLVVLLAQSRGMKISDLHLADPMEAIRQINYAQEATPLLRLADGRKMRATEIQTEILSRALQYVDLKADFDEEFDLFDYAVNLWERGIWAIHHRDWGGISKELDFAVKWQMVEQYLQRTKEDLGAPKVARLLLAYHQIGEGGLRPRLEESGLLRRITSVGAVQASVYTPPATTRAKVRGALVEEANRFGLRLQVEWANAKIDNDKWSVALSDPFDADLAPVREFQHYLEGRDG